MSARHLLAAHMIGGAAVSLALAACAPPARATSEGAAGRQAAARPAPLVAVSVDRTRIAYEARGSGPALLLIHGTGQSRRAWSERGYVDRLSKSFKVITLDLRGSGDSGKPRSLDAYALDRVLADVLAVAHAAGAETFYLWGFGRGATIARYLAASDRVHAAVLVNTPLGPPVTGAVEPAMIAMRDYWLPLIEAEQAGTLPIASLSIGDRAALSGTTPITALALGALVDYPPVEPAKFKAPTLWVVGADDQALADNAARYAPQLAGTKVTLKVLNGDSYSDGFANAAEMLEQIEPFLLGHRDAAPPPTDEGP